MQSLAETAPAFVEMAHSIVWCSAATVDAQQRPWSRVLHPIWQWDGESLTGWIATGPTPIKRAHLEHSAHISLNYWRLRVYPGTVLLGQGGDVLTWQR